MGAIDQGVEIRRGVNVKRVDSEGVYYSVSPEERKESNGAEMKDEGDFFLSSDLVLVNADLPYATETILSNNDNNSKEHHYDWDDKFDYSSGVIAFHWSLDKEISNLNTHNVFLVAENRNKAENS